MSLAAGASLGTYTVIRLIGAGGMGEVYQARDTRLSRDVAIKVLHSDVAQDRERLARFTREAQTLAALNHPHIAAIYGLEEAGGVRALVLELVEGPTLADRIAQGSLPVHEAMPIAHQIALALQAAHEQGIIHRDLKPANIKITRDGVVKVLDFGLAKTLAPARSSHEMSQSPTITTPAQTLAGVILGTAAYMAPEQAKGLEADKRSDMWAFGCVLYEMLTATRPFEGEDISETLAAVLMREPDWTRLPPTLPRPIHTLLRRCLERDRRKRMADMAGALFAMEDAVDASVSSPRARFAYAGWVAAALVAVAAAIVVVPSLRRPPIEAETLRLQIVTPPTADPLLFGLSPDGRSVVFQSGVQLWLRRLDSDEAAADGNRRCELSLLVAGQPVGRVLCRRSVEANRPRWRFRADRGKRAQPEARRVEPRRHDPLRRHVGAVVPGTSRGRGSTRSERLAARAIEPPLA